jgi:hypothetical protein
MPACSHSVLYPSSNAYCASFSSSNCPSFKQYGCRLDLHFQLNRTYRKYKETSHMFCSNSLISGNLSCLVPFDKEGTWGIWNKLPVLFFLMLCSWFFHSPTEGVCYGVCLFVLISSKRGCLGFFQIFFFLFLDILSD